jgi:hypothetical protein
LGGGLGGGLGTPGRDNQQNESGAKHALIVLNRAGMEAMGHT